MMTENVRRLAKLLESNGAHGNIEDHVEFFESLACKFGNRATNLGARKSIVEAVFGYVENHHGFDLASREQAETIISTVFELTCPIAADDERSAVLLRFLSNDLERRIAVL